MRSQTSIFGLGDGGQHRAGFRSPSVCDHFCGLGFQLQDENRDAKYSERLEIEAFLIPMIIWVHSLSLFDAKAIREPSGRGSNSAMGRAGSTVTASLNEHFGERCFQLTDTNCDGEFSDR